MLRVLYVGSFLHYEFLLMCRPSLFPGLQFLRMLLLAFAAINYSGFRLFLVLVLII
jgi:hypothetical protein